MRPSAEKVNKLPPPVTTRARPAPPTSEPDKRGPPLKQKKDAARAAGAVVGVMCRSFRMRPVRRRRPKARLQT